MQRKTDIFLYCLKYFFIFIFAILGVHALTYFLIRFLPTTARVMLGIYGGQHEAYIALANLVKPRPYMRMLLGLFTFDFGISSDGVAVKVELYKNFLISLPRIFFAIFFSIISILCVADLAIRSRKCLFAILTYLLFIPAYGISFVLFVLFVLLNSYIPVQNTIVWVVCAFASSIPPSLLLSSQTYIIMRKNFESQHAINYLSLGVSLNRLKFILYKNLVYEIAPTLEKAMTGIITGLMFAEMVFGLPGIGALAIRAIRRSDTELLLGVVVVFSLLVGVARLLSIFILSFYRGVK